MAVNVCNRDIKEKSTALYSAACIAQTDKNIVDFVVEVSRNR